MCKGKTKKGENCRNKAGEKGYCYLHDNELKNERNSYGSSFCQGINKNGTPCGNTVKEENFCYVHKEKREEKEETKPRCKAITSNRKECNFFAKHGNFCEKHHKKYQTKPLIEHVEGLTKECTHYRHVFNSCYLQNNVPIEKFYKDDKNPQNLYKQCDDCRKYEYKKAEKLKNNFKNLKEEKEKNNENEFTVCLSTHHNDSTNKSPYSKDRVPKKLFLKNPDDPNSEQSENCLHCRELKAKTTSERVKKIHREAKEKGMRVCDNCTRMYSSDEMGKNLDGSASSHCPSCKETTYERNKKKYVKWIRKFRNLQYEEIIKNGSCCEKCEKIFIMSDVTPTVIEISTFIENGTRYLLYEGKKYESLKFLQDYRDKLAFLILDFDHLPEEEFKKLYPDKEFIPKKSKVFGCKVENEARKEKQKCQLLCCRCHIIITIEREKGENDSHKGGLKLKREELVNNVKKQGCSVCGFFDENLLRFLEMDHLDPSNKKFNISNMVQNNFSLEEIMDEMKKCRVICRFCHRIHTKWQRDQGII
jgi:hypothetical protein